MQVKEALIVGDPFAPFEGEMARVLVAGIQEKVGRFGRGKGRNAQQSRGVCAEPSVADRLCLRKICPPIVRERRSGHSFGGNGIGNDDFDELIGVREESRIAFQIDENFDQRQGGVFGEVDDAFAAGGGMPAPVSPFASYALQITAVADAP